MRMLLRVIAASKMIKKVRDAKEEFGSVKSKKMPRRMVGLS